MKVNGVKNTSEPTDLHCSDKITPRHFSDCLVLCSTEDKVIQVWNDMKGKQ